MRMIWGFIGLLIALAIVAMLVKKQIGATRIAVPPAVTVLHTRRHIELSSRSIRAISLWSKSGDTGIASNASSASHTTICDSANALHAAHTSMCFSNTSARAGSSFRLQ